MIENQITPLQIAKKNQELRELFPVGHCIKRNIKPGIDQVGIIFGHATNNIGQIESNKLIKFIKVGSVQIVVKGKDEIKTMSGISIWAVTSGISPSNPVEVEEIIASRL